MAFTLMLNLRKLLTKRVECSKIIIANKKLFTLIRIISKIHWR